MASNYNDDDDDDDDDDNVFIGSDDDNDANFDHDNQFINSLGDDYELDLFNDRSLVSCNEMQCDDVMGCSVESENECKIDDCDSVSNCSYETELSCDAQSFSHIDNSEVTAVAKSSSGEVVEYESEKEYIMDDCDTVSNCSCETELSSVAPSFSPIVNSEVTAVAKPISGEMVSYEHQHLQIDWKGFKMVGDNIDKTIRPSFQRYDNRTNSLHYFHYYALLDRLDLSICSESSPTNALNLQQLLVSQDDIQQVESDAIVLFSRYNNHLFMLCVH